MQGADGVEDGVAGRELVIDQHEHRVGGVRTSRVGRARTSRVGRMRSPDATPGPRTRHVTRQQVRVLRQQQVRGGVRVRLLESARPRHARHGAARRVEIRCGAEPVGDRVAEAGGRLRVAQHDRVPCPGLPEEFPYPAAELESGAVDHGGVLRHVLAEHMGHEQMRPLGVAPQGEAQQLPQFGVAHQLDAQPLRDPATRPHHVRRLFPQPCARSSDRTRSHAHPHPHPHPGPSYKTPSPDHPHPNRLIPRGSRPGVPRSPRLPWPPRRPRPAEGCARPRPGAASLRSSCSCTRTAALRRPRSPAAGCPGRH